MGSHSLKQYLNFDLLVSSLHQPNSQKIQIQPLKIYCYSLSKTSPLYPLSFHFTTVEMDSMRFSAGMGGIWRDQLKPRKPTKHFKGKCLEDHSFEVSVDGYGPVLALMLVWGSFVFGSCEDFSMVSVPLGFEVSGYEARHWVSENGVFAFGFLPDFQKGDGFVVGIWYNFKGRGVAEMPPVWTVGGGIRVSENSTFQLSRDGSLLLFENPTGLLVWSSNTASLGVQEANLLNNGNLILRGFGQKVVWESFHSPTDTLLPGQSLHFPQTLQAPSANSIAGYYSFVIRDSGDLALVWDNNVTYWSSGLGPAVSAAEARVESNGVLGLFDANGSIVWHRSSKDVKDPSVVFRHLRIDADGNLRIYSWDDALQAWKVVWQAVENQCNVFGSCGLYSICGYNSTGPVCNCLVPDSLSLGAAPGVEIGSYGCKKMTDLSNCKMGISMFVLKQTVLYGLYPPHDVDTMLSVEACRDYCLNDSSCYAATARNDGSGLCTIKRTGFISGYRYASVSATSFLKVCLVPQAVSTQETDLHNHQSSMQLSKPRSTPQVDYHKGLILAIGVLFLLTASVFLTIEMFVFWFIYRRRQIKGRKRVPFQKDALLNRHYSALIRLSFEEVKELMKNFTVQIGPTVFKGILPNQVAVVAKVLKNVVASEKDFRMAVSTLGSTHHRNLVALKGFCFELKHTTLLYEYINNGSLDQWLLNIGRDRNQGSWQQRLDIAIGVARAIAYLHLECQQCIAHGNLKLENILLDEQLVAKVTDFGLHCLLQKEAASSSETLPERDVYMFGEMLLQIVTGKRDADLHLLVYNMCRDEKLSEVIDDRLEGGVEWDSVERMVRIALWCMQDQPFLRPSIGEVVKVLEGALQVDTPPASTAFMSKENQTAEGDLDVIEAAS
ncbi:G-type lectin S-receptor-like serine/threonine-protein kinase SD3-1 [Magnolia sinica]|uniref:G-type lectin S-receptor-like serine/threonine-protein kinase SD3-1 n=1 Tax=Magnolia sinica TaxID=86752 RepID=UPI00265896C3|nr:G-type lectin S-receptor-like serine/threonine-protein kinase SD3-1 [Magnolia sinica]